MLIPAQFSDYLLVIIDSPLSIDVSFLIERQ